MHALGGICELRCSMRAFDAGIRLASSTVRLRSAQRVMANDYPRRAFPRPSRAKSGSPTRALAARPLAPGLFPLLRYAVEYGLTILVVTLFIALLMHMLAGTLLRLITVPGWPGRAAL